MAFGDPYANTADLELRVGQPDDSTYAAVVDAASRAVERFTNRQFNKDDGAIPVATARQFRPLDGERLPVDDFHTLTDLVVEQSGVLLDLATIDPRPWDGQQFGIVWPYSDLFRSYWNGPSRRPSVTVTAHWGWASVPAAIKLATLDVAEAMVASSSRAGPVESMAIDGYTVRYGGAGLTAVNVPPEFVKAEPYRRKKFGVA